MIQMIVARARNGVIGANNKMLWHIPEDFAFFKKTTLGNPIIMGRKTWESIGRPLPGRKNIVISRNPNYVAEGATVVTSIEKALQESKDSENVFIIGGANVYRQSLHLAQRIYITFVDKDFDGDATFPDLDKSEWRETIIERLPQTEKRDYKVTFTRWDRI